LHQISNIQVVGNIFFNSELFKLNTVHLQCSGFFKESLLKHDDVKTGFQVAIKCGLPFSK